MSEFGVQNLIPPLPIPGLGERPLQLQAERS